MLSFFGEFRSSAEVSRAVSRLDEVRVLTLGWPTIDHVPPGRVTALARFATVDDAAHAGVINYPVSTAEPLYDGGDHGGDFGADAAPMPTLARTKSASPPNAPIWSTTSCATTR